MSTKIIAAVSLALLLSATSTAIAQKEFKKQKPPSQSVTICKQITELVSRGKIWHGKKCEGSSVCECTARDCKKPNTRRTFTNVQCKPIPT